MKRVTITFDYEGTWGMPFAAPYDLAATTTRLLQVLSTNNAKAVFFVTGKLIEEYPEVIRIIHRHGHEIGFHGYIHEHMDNLSMSELNSLAANLAQTAQQLKTITGYAPKGFRAPYLMGPTFYNAAVYQALADQGFTWISNREIRMPEELFRPDRLRFGFGVVKIAAIRRLLLIALNLKLISAERPNNGWHIISALRWLLGAQQPYIRPEGLTEFPLTSPLDCDLVGFPRPQQPSGSSFTTYAAAVISNCYDVSGPYFNVNSHDWITGSADRTDILDKVLKHINADPDARYYLPGIGGDTK